MPDEPLTFQDLIVRAGYKTPYNFSKVVADKVSYGTIRNWYTGRSAPTLSIFTLRHILGLLNCSFDDFIQAVQQSQSGYQPSKSPKVNSQRDSSNKKPQAKNA
jgi:transcriptional regulator with XRE-family HTH domain